MVVATTSWLVKVEASDDEEGYLGIRKREESHYFGGFDTSYLVGGILLLAHCRDCILLAMAGNMLSIFMLV